MKTFRSIVRESLDATRDFRIGDVGAYADSLSADLKERLEAEGYRIHDARRCVRPPGDPDKLGRPMTPEEEGRLL